jgi:hypothetical protein
VKFLGDLFKPNFPKYCKNQEGFVSLFAVAQFSFFGANRSLARPWAAFENCQPVRAAVLEKAKVKYSFLFKKLSKT